MTDWVPPHGLGPLCFQTRWSFIRIQYVSPWNHVARRDLDCSGHGSGLSQSRGNSSGTCCKSKCQNNDTPRETRTLLLVNTHHNLRLLSLNRIVFYLMGAWALDTRRKMLSQTQKLHYLICTNSAFYDPTVSPPQCDKCSFQKTWLSEIHLQY